MRSIPALLVGVLLVSFRALAAPSPDAGAVRASLDRARGYLDSIATHGGFLWRYSLDLKNRAGENTATETQIWIQPPGTPTIGSAYLVAYEATRDPRFLESARGCATALVTGQLESGGWDYVIDFDPAKAPRWYRRADVGSVPAAAAAKRRNISTYDDNTTQSALSFLLAYCDATKGSTDPRDTAVRAARDYGLAKLLEAQYPIGAWPQRWDGRPRDASQFPVKPATYPESYSRESPKETYFYFYTFNDHTQRDLILLMLDAARRTGRDDLRQAALRGGEFLIRAQMPEPQPGWAQQYDSAMHPAWARAFEPPAIASGETVGVVRTLLELHIETGDDRFLKPIAPAMAWLERSAIAPNRWARYYELLTNKPIYGDRDGKIYHRLEDISEERRNGYGWQGEFGVESTERSLAKLDTDGREKILRSRTPREYSEAEKASRAKSLASKVAQILAAQDEQGRWLSGGEVKKADWAKGPRIETSTFAANIETLSAYLKLVQ